MCDAGTYGKTCKAVQSAWQASGTLLLDEAADAAMELASAAQPLELAG